MNGIEIKCSASRIDAAQDLRKVKVFVAMVKGDEFGHRAKEVLIPEWKLQIIESIRQRILQDADFLIDWKEDDASLIGAIKIVPAVDYEPKNE